MELARVALGVDAFPPRASARCRTLIIMIPHPRVLTDLHPQSIFHPTQISAQAPIIKSVILNPAAGPHELQVSRGSLHIPPVSPHLADFNSQHLRLGTLACRNSREFSERAAVRLWRNTYLAGIELGVDWKCERLEGSWTSRVGAVTARESQTSPSPPLLLTASSYDPPPSPLQDFNPIPNVTLHPRLPSPAPTK